jgi:uncharacterized protein (TIGR03032 family)
MDEDDREPVVGYTHTPEVYNLMKSLKLSLLVSTYQAQRTLLFTAGAERMSMLMRLFERPTGLAYNGDRLAVCAKTQIYIFERVFDIRAENGELLPYDVTFAPRTSFVTGDISVHDAAWVKGQLIFVNTRFSCLAGLSDRFSFNPLWRPPFVTELAADDRCHLNGLAADENGVHFVTALGETNTPEGWRENKKNGGVLIHVPSGQVISRGLCMPHSPRIYGGRLWLLDSGYGQLITVDPQSGVRETVVTLPGYLRGLTFFDRFAFIGLNKIRESNIFGGMPISERLPELKCAIYVVDLKAGLVVGFIEFTKGIEELFDIIVIPNYGASHMVGFDGETLEGLYTLPPNSR